MTAVSIISPNSFQGAPAIVSDADTPKIPFPKIEAQPSSNFRRVFQSSDQMKTEFVKFLQTIFYQLDDQKVLDGMEKLLSDPDKTDEEIYKELLQQIGGMKKRFAPLWQIKALRTLKSGMGKQAAEHLKDFKKDQFHDYMEIYDRRYLNDIRKHAKMPLERTAVAVSDHFQVGMADRLQAGALLSSYPYKTHVPLNDPECTNPGEQPELTHKPVGDEVASESIDLIACLGGLHHIPKDRVDDFVESLYSKLRAGAVILMRDHDVADGASKVSREDLEAMVSVVHTFVNESDGVPWEVEGKEIREFKSLDDWTAIMKRHNFRRISPEAQILKNDPTQNGMIAFVKDPQNLEELQSAIRYRNDCERPKDGTRATWIEWGNVRSSKQYAEFVQDHHSYAFDFIGHLRQHWQHFTQYIKESRDDGGGGMKDLIFSDNFAMNMFILFSATIQSVTGYLTSLPSMMAARWQHGPDWREVANLTDLEKFEAKVEKEYSDFIDHTPFYMFDYVGKVKGLWSTVMNSQESWPRRFANVFNASLSSVGYLMKALISVPVRVIYTSDANLEPETIKVLIKDPDNELKGIADRWEREKDSEHEANHRIEEVYSTPDGYKLVSFPRYRPFTKILGYLTETSKLELLEVGSQKGISLDAIFSQEEETPEVAHSRVVYEMDKLQDQAKRRYVTYQVDVSNLIDFQKVIGTDRIEYIHE